MKIKSLLTLTAVLGLMSTSVFANGVCNYFPGGVSCGSGVVDVVNGSGFTNLNGTTVTQLLKTSGYLSSKDANINSFDTSGNAQFTGGVVTGASVATGYLSGTGTTFSDLRINSNLTSYDNSKVGNIVMTCTGLACNVYLKNGSVVDGDINFNGKYGTVYVDSTSSVKGKVVNGRVVNQ